MRRADFHLQKNTRNPIHHAITSAEFREKLRHGAITLPSHVSAAD